MEIVSRVASERPVVIFSKTTCAMSSSIKRLFSDYGVNPAVLELDEMPKGREIEQALTSQIGCSPVVPAVFIGGELVRYKPGHELDLLLSFQAFVKKWF